MSSLFGLEEDEVEQARLVDRHDYLGTNWVLVRLERARNAAHNFLECFMRSYVTITQRP